MKKLTVFISNSKSGAFFEIATGWANALKECGHTAVLWGGKASTWRSSPPDIYIGCSGWRQNIPSNHSAKIAIHVNPYCDDAVQVSGGPLINDRPEAIRWVAGQKPDLVFGYGLQQDIDKWWIKWKTDLGIKAIGMPNAADAIKYNYINQSNKALECDIGWVGGYWVYKAMNMNKYLIPVVKKHNSVWLGWSGPKGLWKGKATQLQIIQLFHSAKVCPVVVEPHTTKYGIDIPERIFKVAACGALVVADPCYGIDRYFPGDSLVLANSPQNYVDLCNKWVKASDDERVHQARKLQREVLAKHTYFNRIQTLLNALGYKEEASAYNSVIDKLLNGMPTP